MNDYQFKLVRIKGEFVWHNHKDTDEAFIVLAGGMDIEFRDGVAHLEGDELFVVPRGIEHRPRSSAPAQLLVIEPRVVANTGESGGELTSPGDVWI
jgi:mannose-6-phosphate isomerase-like protein (cupin superfamily)